MDLFFGGPIDGLHVYLWVGAIVLFRRAWLAPAVVGKTIFAWGAACTRTCSTATPR